MSPDPKANADIIAPSIEVVITAEMISAKAIPQSLIVNDIFTNPFGGVMDVSVAGGVWGGQLLVRFYNPTRWLCEQLLSHATAHRNAAGLLYLTIVGASTITYNFQDSATFIAPGNACPNNITYLALHYWLIR